MYVGVRGPDSRRLLAAWSFDDADIVGDTVLSLAPDSVEGSEPAEQRIAGVNVGCVNGEPMWGDLQTYVEEMSRFVVLLCKSGYRVRFLPTRESDLPTTEAVIRGVDRPECEVVRVFDSYPDYVRAVRECEVFVGQKLHSTAIACMQRVPSLMIEYQPKCRDFMASLGLEKYTVRTDAFTAEVGKAMVDDLLWHRTDIVAQLDDRIRGFRRNQSMAAATLLRHFASLPSSHKCS